MARSVEEMRKQQKRRKHRRANIKERNKSLLVPKEVREYLDQRLMNEAGYELSDLEIERGYNLTDRIIIERLHGVANGGGELHTSNRVKDSHFSKFQLLTWEEMLEKIPYCGYKYGKDEDGQDLFCKRMAGERTNNFGFGPCYLHGGRNVARQTISKAEVKVGELQMINPYDGTLSDEEIEIWNGLIGDKIEFVDQEIKVLTIREKRMMARMKELIDLEEEGKDMRVIKIDFEEGEIDGVRSKKKKTEKAPVAALVLQIEDSLTRMQNTKGKLIELKADLESKQSGDKGEIVSMIKNITASKGRRDSIMNGKTTGEPGIAKSYYESNE